jgi:hypothetical protein
MNRPYSHRQRTVLATVLGQIPPAPDPIVNLMTDYYHALEELNRGWVDSRIEEEFLECLMEEGLNLLTERVGDRKLLVDTATVLLDAIFRVPPTSESGFLEWRFQRIRKSSTVLLSARLTKGLLEEIYRTLSENHDDSFDKSVFVSEVREEIANLVGEPGLSREQVAALRVIAVEFVDDPYQKVQELDAYLNLNISDSERWSYRLLRVQVLAKLLPLNPDTSRALQEVEAEADDLIRLADSEWDRDRARQVLGIAHSTRVELRMPTREAEPPDLSSFRNTMGEKGKIFGEMVRITIRLTQMNREPRQPQELKEIIEYLESQLNRNFIANDPGMTAATYHDLGRAYQLLCEVEISRELPVRAADYYRKCLALKAFSPQDTSRVLVGWKHVLMVLQALNHPSFLELQQSYEDALAAADAFHPDSAYTVDQLLARSSGIRHSPYQSYQEQYENCLASVEFAEQALAMPSCKGEQRIRALGELAQAVFHLAEFPKEDGLARARRALGLLEQSKREGLDPDSQSGLKQALTEGHCYGFLGFET